MEYTKNTIVKIFPCTGEAYTIEINANTNIDTFIDDNIKNIDFYVVLNEVKQW